MKRIISLLAVAALTVMLIALSVGPAFAEVVKNEKGGPPAFSGDYLVRPNAHGEVKNDSRGPLVIHDEPGIEEDAKNCVLHDGGRLTKTGDCAH